jgi:hypothetical protein
MLFIVGSLARKTGMNSPTIILRRPGRDRFPARPGRDGAIAVKANTLPLADVEEAWTREEAPGERTVLVP